MIRLFLLIIGAQGAMESVAEPVELEQFNIDGNLLATFTWSDRSKNDVQMFKASIDDCMYRGSFPEDQDSKVLG